MEEELAIHLYDKELFLIPEKLLIKSFSLAEPAIECRLLILLKDEQEEKVNGKDRDLLNKIVDWKDLNLKREEVIVVNLINQQTGFKELDSRFHSPSMIAFGIKPKEIDLQIESRETELFRFRNVNFIFTSSLQELASNNELKNKFFKTALRPMFNTAGK